MLRLHEELSGRFGHFVDDIDLVLYDFPEITADGYFMGLQMTGGHARGRGMSSSRSGGVGDWPTESQVSWVIASAMPTRVRGPRLAVAGAVFFYLSLLKASLIIIVRVIRHQQREQSRRLGRPVDLREGALYVGTGAPLL